MRATLLALVTIAILSVAAGGCEGGGPHPGAGPGDVRRTTAAGNLGGEPATPQDWRDVAAALLAAQGICGLFRAGNDEALTTDTTHVEMVGYASTPQVPARLVNAVGEYYKGSIRPDSVDGQSALAIRRKHVVMECDRLHI